MAMSNAFLSLPSHVQSALKDRLAPKFNAYMRFTQGLKRSEPQRDADGNLKHYEYPNDSIMSDLGAFWPLFGECREILDGLDLEKFLQQDPALESALATLVHERGEFWFSPVCKTKPKKRDPKQLTKIADTDAEKSLPEIWRTLRNGSAHGRWAFGDFGAVDYWKQNGWDTTGAHPDFTIATRGVDNYVVYIADAAVKPWDGSKFWELNDLRILVTPSGTLRFWLHKFLNVLLNGDHTNVFDHRPA